ncbi:MAG: DUF1176 domain-containing protein [Alphaproteobacteria bacterium]|nr:DUF1176 domain-containing protein [Alphaproteobacteria bacterium]
MLTVVLCLMAWPAMAVAETRTKSVREWTATCDDYSCSAQTAGTGGAGFALEVARAAGGNEVWFVTLITPEADAPAQDPVTFEIEGTLSRDSVVEGAGEGRFGIADQAAIESIFPAMRKGAVLTVRYASGGAPVMAQFSLSGLAAVLLWMDEHQGQVGNSDRVRALDVRDDIRLSAEDMAEIRNQVVNANSLALCDWAREGDDTARFEATKYDLGEGYGLVIVVCAYGAYQESTLLFLDGTEGLEPLPFPVYDHLNGWTASLLLGTVSFDGKTRELHESARFRGAGDCGTWSRYRWNEGYFKMLEYAYLACKDSDEPVGENADMPEFPIIYKAKD